MKSGREIAIVPTEGKWFEVKPSTINQKLFEKKRDDERQEETRKLILEAFDEMKKNSKYEKNFRIMMPKKEWKTKNVVKLKEMAYELGDHNADWVEQAFEWAQRISNGESWENICNEYDTAKWYRLVVWKNGYARLVGGSIIVDNSYPASDVEFEDYGDLSELDYAVPLIVDYDV